MNNRFGRLFTEPLIQFLIIGACIYGAYAYFDTSEQDFRDTTIRVDSNRIDAMISQWESRWNRSPTREEIDSLIQDYIREDVLYRQAVVMGLNEDDPVTRRRMARKLESLTGDLSQMQQPKEGELEQYFLQHQDSYRTDNIITFGHLYINPDKRGDATLSDAAEIMAGLQAIGIPNADTLKAGDRFMLPNYFDASTELYVSQQMGSDFSEVVMGLEPGRWHGPVLSGYGVHLVYIYELMEVPPAVFENVQVRVLKDWHMQKREEFNTAFLENLKSRYEFIIDEVPADRLLKSRTEAAEGKASKIETVARTDSTS